MGLWALTGIFAKLGLLALSLQTLEVALGAKNLPFAFITSHSTEQRFDQAILE